MINTFRDCSDEVRGELYLPTRIVAGRDRLNELPSRVKNLGRKALIVSMRPLSGYAEKLVELLTVAGVEARVDHEVEPNPRNTTVERIATTARQWGAEVIIGLGGGSAMDTAKGVALLVAHGGKLWDYIGNLKVPGPVLPVVAIPTTAGTGSEVTPFAIFSNRDLGKKSGIASDFLFPRVALLDPTLCLTLPAYSTGATGMDALAHAIESYTGPRRQTLAGAHALTAIRLISENLETALREPENVAARERLQLASCLGGIAITHCGTGGAHALGGSVSALLDTDHGTAVALFLGAITRFNFGSAPEVHLKVAQAMGLDLTGLNSRAAAERLAGRIEQMARGAGLKRSIRECGGTEDLLPALVEDALLQNSTKNNCRPLDEASIGQLFRSVL